MTPQILCWIVALVLFAIATFWTPPRFSLVAAGLAFLTTGFLLPLL